MGEVRREHHLFGENASFVRLYYGMGCKISSCITLSAKWLVREDFAASATYLLPLLKQAEDSKSKPNINMSAPPLSRVCGQHYGTFWGTSTVNPTADQLICLPWQQDVVF